MMADGGTTRVLGVVQLELVAPAEISDDRVWAETLGELPPYQSAIEERD